MSFTRGFSLIRRNSSNGSYWNRTANPHPIFFFSSKTYAQSLTREPLHDPFALVSDELSLITDRLRNMVVAQVPKKLTFAAEYFFKFGVEVKRLRPTVLLLLSTAVNEPPVRLGDVLSTQLRARQQSLAEVTEMVHVASLLHGTVLDYAETKRSSTLGSFNSVMGDKVAVLAGDFLLARACVALASLKNTEVFSLLSTVLEHVATCQTMQSTTAADQCCSIENYMEKTYYKTASLVSNSCKGIAILAGNTTPVVEMAYDYGKNLGLAFQLTEDVFDFVGTSESLGKGSLSDIRNGIITAPILFAAEEIPQLHKIVEQGFDNPSTIEIALDYLGKSNGIQRTRELARKHAHLAAEAIECLPESYDEHVRIARRALLDLTNIVITRTK